MEMSDGNTPERAALHAGAERLLAPLSAQGFAYSRGDQGVSSGGPFAVGFFRRDALQIGLIIRSGHELGCPSYSAGRGYAGHADLMYELGAAGREQLVEDRWWAFKGRDGGDPFEALRHDLESIVLPALASSEPQFVAALGRAVDRSLANIGLPPRNSG